VPALAFVGDVATVQGATGSAVDDGTGRCGVGNGSDVVYQFTLAAPQAVKVDLAAEDPLVPMVYVRKSCSDTGQSEEACAVGAAKATAEHGALAAGTYYVFVDGLGRSAGDFTLTVTKSAPVAAPNDNCPEAAAMSLDAGGGWSATGTTVGAVNHTGGTCSGSSGGDVVFQFTTSAAHKATVSVTPDAASKTYAPVIYLRRTCAETGPSELACGYTPTALAVASAVVNNLPAGTYFVWVDGYLGSAGKFRLDVKLEAPVLPPANDVCAAPVALTRGVQVSGDTSIANADYGGTLGAVCSGEMAGNAKGRDLVYRYTPTTSGPFTIELAPSAWDASLWYTTGTCGDAAACVHGSDRYGDGTLETLTVQGVAGTTYFIVVDTYFSAEAGAFSVEVR